jgi:carbamate kinase
MTATTTLPATTPGAPRRRPVVVALGGNALRGRGPSADAGVLRRNVASAVKSIADVAADHDVVVAHSNRLQGMIGYLLEQGLADTLPGREIATVRMRGVVDADDLRTIRLLVAAGVLVVCAGAPAVVDAARTPPGAEAVVDTDVAAALLATCLGAEALLMLTDVSAVQRGWGTPAATPVRSATPDDLWRVPFAAGSMAPKVRAACRFVEATGGVAAIGALADARELLAGRRGTIVRAVDEPAPRDAGAARGRLALVPATVARSIGTPTAGGFSA